MLAAGLEFAEITDPATRDIEAYLRVKLFYDQPRIIITSSAEQADGSTAVEPGPALHDRTRHRLSGPGRRCGQNCAVDQGHHRILSRRGDRRAVSGGFPGGDPRIFDEMAAQSIEPVLVTPNTSYLLDLYLADAAAYAYAQEALLKAKTS